MAPHSLQVERTDLKATNLGVYEPHEVEILQQTFDTAAHALHIKRETNEGRRLARQIISLHQSGILKPDEIVRAVLSASPDSG